MKPMSDKPNYYAIIPADVRYSNLKPNAKLLYGEITALSGKLGYCYASNNYFADLYGVSKNTVSRWISDLNKLGFINIEVERNEKKQVIKRKIGIIHKDDRAIYKMSKENTTSINNTSNINITKEKFIAEVMTFDYEKDMLEDFINYWTEGKKKMRYQKQSTFEIKLRLLRWSKNQKKWDQPKQKTSKIDSQLDEYLKGKELL
jgi:DNA-binding transcriptional regulator YhcF (GntR family)